MLIGAIGVSAVSQLVKSLTDQGQSQGTAQGTDRGTATSTTAPEPGTSAAPATLSDPARKLIGDLNAFLLNLQAAGAPPAANTAAPGTTAAAGQPATAASTVPPSPLQIELEKLNQAAGQNTGVSAPKHHRHGHAAAAAVSQPTSTTSASSSDSLIAQFAKALSAYASNVGSTAAATQVTA